MVSPYHYNLESPKSTIHLSVVMLLLLYMVHCTERSRCLYLWVWLDFYHIQSRVHCSQNMASSIVTIFMLSLMSHIEPGMK